MSRKPGTGSTWVIRLEQAWLVLLCQWQLPLAQRRLHSEGLESARNRLRQVQSRPSATPDLARARALARAVNFAARRGPFQAACLVRSLVLCELLAKRRIACDLVLGANRDDGGFAAHAWVECSGEVINDGADMRDRFVVFGGEA